MGRTLGAAEGTGPEDDPFLRAERRQGRVEGRVEALTAAVSQVFKTRGVPVSAALPRRLAKLEGVSAEDLVRAALECRDEADFLRLVETDS